MEKISLVCLENAFKTQNEKLIKLTKEKKLFVIW